MTLLLYLISVWSIKRFRNIAENWAWNKVNSNLNEAISILWWVMYWWWTTGQNLRFLKPKIEEWWSNRLVCVGISLSWNRSLVVQEPKQRAKLSFVVCKFYCNLYRPRTTTKWFHISVWILLVRDSPTLELPGAELKARAVQDNWDKATVCKGRA